MPLLEEGWLTTALEVVDSICRIDRLFNTTTFVADARQELATEAQLRVGGYNLDTTNQVAPAEHCHSDQNLLF